MTVTFLNDNTEKTMEEKGRQHLASRAEDLRFYQHFEAHMDTEAAFLAKVGELLYDGDITSIEQLSGFISQFGDLGPFNEYGLSFDYVELGTFTDQKRDFFRYQFSWGGPSEEIRFYDDETAEFVYLDWFAGVGFDISNEDWAEWVRENFEEIGMMDFDAKRDEYDYYTLKAEIDDE